MSPETRFVLAAVRDCLHPGDPLPDPDGLDWPLVFKIAESHGVGPMIAIAVLKTSGVPESARSPAQRIVQYAARADLELSAELVRLLKLFAGANLPVIPLKGPALRSRLYKDLSLRLSSDLDILVQPASVARVKGLLEASGYKLDSTPVSLSERGLLRSRDSQLSFGFARSIKLDLHWRTLPGYFPMPVSDAAMWSRARDEDFGGCPMKMFAPEDQFLFLSTHGAKHCWERLGWLCDLTRFLDTQPGLDWQYILARSDRTRTARMIALVFLLAHDLLGSPIPEALAPRVEHDLRAQTLADDIQERVLSNRPVASTRLVLRLLERPSYRLRFLSGIVAQPTEAEFRLLRLPDALFALYYPIRAARLLGKHAARAVGK